METALEGLLDKQHIRIPTLPVILSRIEALLQDPGAGVHEFSQVIDKDPPIAARVLKTANSAFYGHAENVRSTDQAVMTIGTRVLRIIVLQASLIGNYEHLEGSAEVNPEELWKHSILTALLSQYLAAQIKITPGLTEESFYTCGLLHDIGKIILLDGLGDEYLDVVREARLLRAPVFQAEASHLGFDHAHLGSVVARRWGLPDLTVRAIERHHDLVPKDSGNVLVPMLANINLVANRIQQGDPAGARSALASPSNGLPQLDSSLILDVVEMGERTWPTIAI